MTRIVQRRGRRGRPPKSRITPSPLPLLAELVGCRLRYVVDGKCFAVTFRSLVPGRAREACDAFLKDIASLRPEHVRIFRLKRVKKASAPLEPTKDPLPC